jgi:hypothetical protein
MEEIYFENTRVKDRGALSQISYLYVAEACMGCGSFESEFIYSHAN